jgi:hypothetical protein
MINYLPRIIIWFVVLVLIQVFLLSNIHIGFYINPFVYVLFILLLPFETPGWALLVLGMFLGLSVDFFYQTPGIHASATVFMSFLRPFVLKSISPRDGYEPGTLPRVEYYGFFWFMKYAAILILIHHVFLFYLEIFRFSDFFHTLLRVFLSWIFSVAFVVSSQYYIFRR